MNFINGNKATILIHEEITEQLAEDILNFVYGLEFATQVSEIYVSINSGGGSVMGAYSIFSALKNSNKKIISCIEGIAASAAGIIFLAGDVRTMTDYSVWMGHNPDGGSDKVLNVIKESLLVILESAFPDEDDLSEMMNEETWLNAETMKQKGVIQNIIYTEEDIKLDTTMTVTNLYLICNDILKKKNINMKNEKKSLVEKAKEIFTKKTEIVAKNEAEKEDEIKEYSDDEDTEKVENEDEETTNEISLESLDAKIDALTELIKQLLTEEDSETEEAENEADTEEEEDKKKEEVENAKKLEVLNKSTFAKSEFNNLLKYDLKTLEDFTNSSKGVVKAPKVEINNEADVKTDFNKLSNSEKMNLLNTNPKLYHELFRNSGTKRKV